MSQTISPVQVATVALCLVVLMVLFVRGVFAWWRRWRERCRMYGTLHSLIPSSASPATKRRIERLSQPETTAHDPLGWSPGEAAEGTTTPQDDGNEDTAALPGRGKTILIADDDAVVVFALSRRLRHLGYTVLHSPDALHALVGVTRARPDLVILDVNMPSGNGLAVCEMMVSDPQYGHTPVIIHSAIADEATKLRAQRLGAHHVEKSSRSWAEIRTLVERLLQPNDAADGQPSAGALPIDHAAAIMPRVERPRQAAEPAVSAASAAKRPAGASSTDPAASAACGPARVLCIESPKGRLETLEQQLSALGVEVVRTSDLNEGYWTCFTDKFGLIVVHAATTEKGLAPLFRNLATHPVTRALPVLWIREGNAEATPQPAPDNLTILQHPVDWEDTLVELEKLLPLFGRRETDLFANAAAPTTGADHSATADEEIPLVQPVESKPLTVLCIDDDPLVARAVALRLNPYGITVTEADNGTSGYLRAVAELPDLILLDLKLPNGEGTYVLGRLKDNSRTKNIPVVVITGETAKSARRQMFSMGADAFLTKPWDWLDLYTEMGRCVQLPQELLQAYSLPEQLTIAQL